MSGFRNIVKKEIKELLTPATILPIVLMTIIFAAIGGTMSGIEEEIHTPPVIGLINENNTTFSSIASDVFYENAEVVFNSTIGSDKEVAIEQIREEGGVALIVIPKNFTERIKNDMPGEIEVYWIMKGAGLMDTISSGSVEKILGLVSLDISSKLIEDNSTANATIVLSPTTRMETTNFKGVDFKGISPGQITSMLSAQSTTIPIVMMMIIIMAGQMVISSMALEKENKTLETLLTLPVKRTSIVAGKIAASAIIGLLLAFVYMLGIGYYMQSFQMGDMSSVNFDLSLSSLDLLLVGISLFVALVAALSLCMLLGTLAKNYKSAQTLTVPITMMALFPMLITMFTDFDTLPLGLKTLVFAIPFSHPMMAARALLFDDYMLVIAGIIYVTIFAIIIIGIVVWVFRTDRLLTGSTNTKKLFKFKK